MQETVAGVCGPAACGVMIAMGRTAINPTVRRFRGVSSRMARKLADARQCGRQCIAANRLLMTGPTMLSIVPRPETTYCNPCSSEHTF
jgi:hypothetical protein